MNMSKVRLLLPLLGLLLGAATQGCSDNPGASAAHGGSTGSVGGSSGGTGAGGTVAGTGGDSGAAGGGGGASAGGAGGGGIKPLKVTIIGSGS